MYFLNTHKQTRHLHATVQSTYPVDVHWEHELVQVEQVDLVESGRVNIDATNTITSHDITPIKPTDDALDESIRRWVGDGSEVSFPAGRAGQGSAVHHRSRREQNDTAAGKVVMLCYGVNCVMR